MPQGTGTPRVVVLVEGDSDAIAVATLAERCGYDLAAAGVVLRPMGGATSVGREVARWVETSPGVTLAGLSDRREAPFYVRALRAAGLGPSGAAAAGEPWSVGELPGLGFGVCDADLEDELIRALGADRVIDVLAAEGELRSFRTLQRQPAHRGTTVEAQLRRFLGTRSGRKAAAARALCAAVDLDRIPAPLRVVLDVVGATPGATPGAASRARPRTNPETA